MRALTGNTTAVPVLEIISIKRGLEGDYECSNVLQNGIIAKSTVILPKLRDTRVQATHATPIDVRISKRVVLPRRPRSRREACALLCQVRSSPAPNAYYNNTPLPRGPLVS